MATHAENKARRREAILAAAKRLIRLRSDGEFSMPELASEAGTSLATPYNLIGPKDAVFLALYDEDNARFRERLAQVLHGDPIERLWSAPGVSVSFWLEDEGYFRHLARRIQNASPQVQHYTTSVRHQFWLEQTSAARRLLSRHFEPSYLAFTFAKIHASSLREWAQGNVPSDCVVAELSYGIAVALMGVVVPARRPQVAQAALGFQRTLAERGWRPPERAPGGPG